MAVKSNAPNDLQKNDLMDEVRRNRERRENTYREQALKLFPHICAHCGREFAGKKLRELTVHHKDHDHNNNPADGSNWELLCIYCHDNEHARLDVAEAYGDTKEKLSPKKSKASSGFNTPFADLAEMLKKQN